MASRCTQNKHVPDVQGMSAKWDVGTTYLGVGIIVEGNEKMRR